MMKLASLQIPATVPIRGRWYSQHLGRRRPINHYTGNCGVDISLVLQQRTIIVSLLDLIHAGAGQDTAASSSVDISNHAAVFSLLDREAGE